MKNNLIAFSLFFTFSAFANIGFVVCANGPTAIAAQAQLNAKLQEQKNPPGVTNRTRIFENNEVSAPVIYKDANKINMCVTVTDT
jgi:hypothetical protein